MKRPKKTGNPYLARYVRTIREAHEHGFDVGILVELALAGSKVRAPYDASERPFVRQLYIDALPARDAAFCVAPAKSLQEIIATHPSQTRWTKDPLTGGLKAG